MKEKFRKAIIILLYGGWALILLMIKTLSIIKVVIEKAAKGTFWISVFYQPFVLIITMLLFSRKLGELLLEFAYGNGDLASLLLWCLIIIFVILYINALTQFLFLCRKKEEKYIKFIGYQKATHNYALLIISFIAIYVAAFPNNAMQINMLLLTFDILFLLCTIIVGLYEYLFAGNHVVEKVYNKMKENIDNELQ